MQTSTKNPDTRPLPPGWRGHFDAQRNLWYYIDLESVPPRASFEHPAAGVSCASSSWLDSAEVPESFLPNSFLTSPDAIGGTFAQKLYASSIYSLRSLNPSPNPLANSSTAEGAPSPESAVPVVRVTDTTTSSSSSLVPLPSATSSNLGCVDNVKPAQRSRKARNMTVPGLSVDPPRGTTSPPPSGGSGSLYSHSVATAPLLGPRTLPIGPRSHHRRASSANDNPTERNQTTKLPPTLPLVVTKRHHSPSTLAPAKQPNRNRSGTSPGLYSASTNDNIYVIPQHGSASMATMSTAVSGPQPQDGGLPLPRAVSSDHIVIRQPKPVKPLKGVSLSLQDQLAAMALEAAATDQIDQKLNKKKQRSHIIQRLLGAAS